MELQRVAGALGAEIAGVRLSGSLDEHTITEIKAALHQHKVIFFRNQVQLDDAEHASFSALLGEPFENPSLPDDVIAAAGAMYQLDGARPDGRAETWHTDSTFCHAPPSAAVLRSVVTPAYGGDTTWANCVRAYETLTPVMQELADQLWAVHSNQFDYAAFRPDSTEEEREYFERITTGKTVVTEHPLVRVHPVTGERSLLVGKYAQQIVGYPAVESERLKALFQDHISKLANTLRWRWRADDVVIWDNNATQHCVVNDWGTQPRVLRRWTLAGDVPTSVDGRPSVAIQTPD